MPGASRDTRDQETAVLRETGLTAELDFSKGVVTLPGLWKALSRRKHDAANQISEVKLQGRMLIG